MSEREEVLLERAYVLHHRPFRNTSQIVECLTASFGRIGLVARGSRRPRGGQKALLQPFVPLRVSWLRRGDLGRLTHVELDQGAFTLGGDALLAGFYVNELVLRLLARGDTNDRVFTGYVECLRGLAEEHSIARRLRLFELELLGALGYGLDLGRDIHTGEPLQAEWSYLVEHENGPTRITAPADAIEPQGYRGKDLISLRDRVLDDADSLRAARILLGRMLNNYLGERPLKTRSVFREIMDRGLGR
jgi:DNA repair protein RecO (recombination protein O)